MASSILEYIIKNLSQSNVSVAKNIGMDDYFDMAKSR